MHGRLKVKTTEEQEAAKEAERQVRVKKYLKARDAVFAMRAAQPPTPEALLGLTEKMLGSNPDIYTLWNIRRETLGDALSRVEADEDRTAVLAKELELSTVCLKANPKSYGAWQQRIWAMERFPAAPWEEELALCTKFLKLDTRNFHCWDYRRFVAPHCPSSSELAYTKQKIEENFSNYSAWHYRSNLLQATDAEAVEEEMLMVTDARYIKPNDQSAWFYHRWLLGRKHCQPTLLCAHTIPPAPAAAVEPGSSADATGSTLLLEYSLPVFMCGGKSTVQAGEGEPAAVEFEPCRASLVTGPSTLWLCRLPAAQTATVTTLTVQLPDSAVTNARGGAMPATTVCIQSSTASRHTMVCFDPSLGTKVLWRREIPSRSRLEAEAAVCQELMELTEDEPTEAVWTKLSYLEILHNLDGDRSEIPALIESLLEIDSNRRGYYQDMHSRYQCEGAIKAAGDGLGGAMPPELSLAGLGITALSYAQRFAAVSRLDLSGNRLTDLRFCGFLVGLVTLVLDDNELAAVPAGTFAGSQLLASVSLKGNRIAVLGALEGIVEAAPRLATVNLSGNPVAALSDTAGWAKGQAPACAVTLE